MIGKATPAGAIVLLLLPLASAFDTDPGASDSFAVFPTHSEVLSSLAAHDGDPWVRLYTVGNSSEGRAIQVAQVTDPGSTIPMAERVVTFIFTQQHGNEPAGTPAALRLLDDLIENGTSLLDNQILLLLPMANPDGATLNQRANQQGTDINRDHIALDTTEAGALHEVFNRWDVHVAMDHHEYSGTGFGNPVPVRLYDYDITTMYPNHGNVRTPTSDASQELMYEAIWPAATAAGFTANEYGEQTVAGIPIDQVAGGPDPGIMRNHVGLHHITGLLVETRVDAHPNPFHDAERRIASHRLVMDATIQFAHDHAKMLRDAKWESERLSLESPQPDYVEGTLVGPLEDAYATASGDAVAALFARHQLAGTVATEQGYVFSMNHTHQGHAAALLHPASSRKVVTDAHAVPVPVVPEPSLVPEERIGSATPGISGLLVMGATGLLGFTLRRGRSRPAA